MIDMIVVINCIWVELVYLSGYDIVIITVNVGIIPFLIRIAVEINIWIRNLISLGNCINEILEMIQIGETILG